MARKIQCKCCGTIKLVNKTSGYVGVNLHKPNSKWRVRATDQSGRTHSLGYYFDEIESAIHYDDFIINNQIPNRPLNFPERLRDDVIS